MTANKKADNKTKELTRVPKVIPYGKFYDATIRREPSHDSHYDVVVYTTSFGCGRSISSLEGVFLLSDNSPLRRDIPDSDLICKREEMKKFERKYNGKFIPFYQAPLA